MKHTIGINMECNSATCGYRWTYFGASTKIGQYATCPRCKKSIKILE